MRNGQTQQVDEAGYVVLRRFFDSVPLAAELDHAIGEGIGRAQPAQRFPAGKYIASLGCIANLDPLAAATGALQILPRSHMNRTVELPEAGWNGGVAIDSDPGDVIVFDEHLVHPSSGGRERRQWRVDFVHDPSDNEISFVQEWFAQSVPDERQDVGYHAHLYPSYGDDWRHRYPTWAARLADLGILDQRSLP